jgi:flagellar hook protein FlgE
MAFSTAISGINAATADLGVISNNIANASTTGFKASKAQFADVYATSLLGAGSNAIGQGVSLAGVRQEFGQGNVTFTNNSLDLAINGSGFFQLSQDGASSTRVPARFR